MFSIAAVCERFGWTYQQYIEQPTSFLEAIAIKIKVEARLQRNERDRAERDLKR